MKKNIPFWLLVFSLLISCQKSPDTQVAISESSYLDFSNRDDQWEGGIRMIPIQTPKGEFKVWTKRVGNNPTQKVLLLHGGPGWTHEIFMSYDGYLPQEGIEYIYYDQLGSYYSDQPEDSSLWTIERFVDEVEQVRQALGLDQDNFYLYGQSWGGILAMEYAFRHQDKLKGLIISNMMASLEDYENYAKEVLGPQMPKEVYEEVMEMEQNQDFSNPRYGELLMEYYYPEHVLRKPLEEWPEAFNRAMKHMNPGVYVYMQGFSEFGITPGASLKGWDVKSQLPTISVPTLVVGSQYDTMDPEHMKWMASQVQNGRYLHCPEGAHLVQYDDQEHFFPGLIQFVKDVDMGNF
ncbi:proline iminopeptidase-family hydrolase [Algoriphagus sp. CAU 1675]|uniref:proline iminopeptidase-family hydrolase n=1 Tax=Algoriphagus sp. CAU 1675 TaxID=3032597 RepID=UPI0023DB0E86|nr:proline iminopeptidase-family hydrolase [Algoriphagus sp. CAU 1675]MDF2157486.1 proline iminopeptidase-family hydrolase [Algoriphagus sp. CAU 1675]